MPDEELRSSPERLLPAIVIGLLLPMAIAPLVQIMTLLFFRSFDLVGQLWGIAAEATYYVFHESPDPQRPGDKLRAVVASQNRRSAVLNRSGIPGGSIL
jgi:hypothetical protein